MKKTGSVWHIYRVGLLYSFVYPLWFVYRDGIKRKGQTKDKGESLRDVLMVFCILMFIFLDLFSCLDKTKGANQG